MKEKSFAITNASPSLAGRGRTMKGRRREIRLREIKE